MLFPSFAPRRGAKAFAAVLLVSLLAACSSTPKSGAGAGSAAKPSATKPSGAGGYYLDDGPGADAGKNASTYLDSIPDAIPRNEKFHSGANKPYTVFGRSYAPALNNDPFRQTGIASWYGRKFHGNMTSNGQIYDMYAMTAAHPTLPLPSYVRVTNPANARSVVVRVNDRGPFHSDRIIDLSYAAAHRLDIVRRGSGQVTVERVFAGDRPLLAAQPQLPPLPLLPPTTLPSVATTATPAPVASNTTSPPVISTSPITTDGTQLFLQLGAFSSQENANIFRDRMARELDWNREPIIAVFKDGRWRVRLGPYITRIEAEAIQTRVKQSHDFSPVISKP